MGYKIDFKVIIKIVGIPGLIALGGILAFTGRTLNNGTAIYGEILIAVGICFWITLYLVIPVLKKKKIV